MEKISVNVMIVFVEFLVHNVESGMLLADFGTSAEKIDQLIFIYLIDMFHFGRDLFAVE